MIKQRSRRVAEQMKKEISEILYLELKDPGLMEIITVMAVEVTRDLRFAKVFISAYGNEEEQKKVLRILEKAAGFIRRELGKRIRLRHIPEIEFNLDRTLEYSNHIEGMLKKLGLDAGADELKDE